MDVMVCTVLNDYVFGWWCSIMGVREVYWAGWASGGLGEVLFVWDCVGLGYDVCGWCFLDT